MQIGEIGEQFKSTIEVHYRSDRTFLDFDALIVDMEYILHQTENIEFLTERRKEFEEFVKFKKVPIIAFTPSSDVMGLDNQPSLNYSSLVPIPHLETKSGSGKVMSILKGTPFTQFFEQYSQYLYYDNYFVSNFGTALIEIPHRRNVISLYTHECVFIPRVRIHDINIEMRFLSELIMLSKKIFGQTEEISAPSWTTSYKLKNEEIIENEIQELETKIRIIERKKEVKQNELNKIVSNKKLFFSTGNDLEVQIERIFEELGFDLIESNRYRDDLIVQFGNKKAVIEIKGVNGSAAEKHSAQLEKWVAGFYEENNEIPKGILIVNTFKDTKLAERREFSFPEQMLKYSKQKEHCLMTSTQLLGLYYEVLNHPEKKQELIDSLFYTIGIYNGFTNWEDFIELKNISNQTS